MKIILATGIFTPEIGGPATYVPALAKEFVRLGTDVTVLTYSDSLKVESDGDLPFPVKRIKRSGTLSNYTRYFFALLKLSRKADVIYCFDHMSAGVPAALVSYFSDKLLFIRVGGDFIWERYLRMNHEAVSLREYYEKELYKKEKIRFPLIQWVFGRAKKLFFTTAFQADIFSEYYGFSERKVEIVPNPLPCVEKGLTHQRKNDDIIFAGRLNRKNNVLRLIQAFADAQSEGLRLRIIGDGEEKESLFRYVKDNDIPHVVFENAVSREKLLQIFSECYVAVFPSLTDISPNTMLDCLAVGTPFLTSKEIGYAWVLEHAKSFDPKDVSDMKRVLEEIMDVSEYEEYRKAMAYISYSQTFSATAEQTLSYIEESV
ncbi:MAG: glycosyltransferase family 4 protein [Candidatus Magasanikbacteria bacterium]